MFIQPILIKKGKLQSANGLSTTIWHSDTFMQIFKSSRHCLISFYAVNCRQNESFKRFLDVTLSHSMTIIWKLLEKGYQSLGHTYIQVCKHDIVISSHKNAVKRRKVPLKWHFWGIFCLYNCSAFQIFIKQGWHGIKTHSSKYSNQSALLVADTQLYERLCPSVRPSVRWSVRALLRPSVRPSVRPSGVIELKSGKTSVFDTFWAAAPKGWCPVGHRGEFPDIRPYVRMSPQGSKP